MSLDLKALVERYLDTVASGSAAATAALFTEDATVEDPVGGGEVHIGRKAIEGFYKNIEGAELKAELLNFRAGGHEAAFAFALIRDFDLHAAVRFAVAVATLSCRAYGGRAGLPDFEEAREVMERLESRRLV